MATALDVQPVTTFVGATITGADLSKPLTPDELDVVSQALIDHGVVFFRDQDLTRDQMRAFVTNFGVPMPEPFGGDKEADPIGEADFQPTKRATAVWHSDTTYVEEPPGFTALRAIEVPSAGGDTCWASMYAAYEALSAPLRSMLDGLTAVHSVFPVIERMGLAGREHADQSASDNGSEFVHPVVRVHPRTGRKALFVNEGWTTRIVELETAESQAILAMLFEHVKSPDFMMRWHWVPNSMTIWDNRSVQHYAVSDYEGPRIMQRVVLAGKRPIGPRANSNR